MSDKQALELLKNKLKSLISSTQDRITTIDHNIFDLEELIKKRQRENSLMQKDIDKYIADKDKLYATREHLQHAKGHMAKSKDGFDEAYVSEESSERKKLKTNIEDIYNEVDQKRTKVANLITEEEYAIKKLKTSIKSNETMISSWNDQINTYQKELDKKRAELKELNKQLADVEAELKTLA